MSSNSLPLVVTSSVAGSSYDLEADLAANSDAQDALDALRSPAASQPASGGGQTEYGIYQDNAEFDADHQSDSVSRRSAPSEIAMNGHDDFESATAAFARHAATMVSDVGY